MEKTLQLHGRIIKYNLTYKKVKNINLRIKPNGTIQVSANKRVSEKIINSFLVSKADFILNALERYKNFADVPQKQYFSAEEIKEVILDLCKKYYPYFGDKGIKYPQIKFRKMISRWGSCNPEKAVITFNINLMYAPPECIEYVIIHEFTHFLQANHSEKFYAELEKVCWDWKKHRKTLKEIYLKY